MDDHRRLGAVAVTLAALVFGGATAAGQDVSWFGHSDEYGASLVFGIPDSGYGLISFVCRPDAPATFTLLHEPISAVDGVEVEVVLASSAGEVTISTIGMRLEIDDAFVLDGPVSIDVVRDVLLAGGDLLVFVEDGAEEIPLGGIEDAARHVFEICG